MPTRRAALTLPWALPLLAPTLAGAQEAYPSRAISVVSGYAPGGVTDVTSRAVAERMGRELAVPMVVENRVGAATAVANTAVAQARPDGYTLLMGTSTLAINPGLQPSLTPKEPLRDLAPIGMVFRTAFVLHVHPDVPARSTAELIAWCKANPGKLNFGSSGTGAVNHLALALFAQAAGIEVTHIPYRGGAPALLDLRAGRIQAMFQAVLEALPTLADNATRGLAISSAERSALLPDIPRWPRPCPASTWSSGRGFCPGRHARARPRPGRRGAARGDRGCGAARPPGRAGRGPHHRRRRHAPPHPGRGDRALGQADPGGRDPAGVAAGIRRPPPPAPPAPPR
ncbi:Bug family tripartite tricarboxylate transporter substrate binding protein [Paeniroseomonas aquatica]